MDLARRTLSSLQAAIAGQRIRRQDRRGELQPFALRRIRRENHPPGWFSDPHRSRIRGTFTRCLAGQCKALTKRGHRADPSLNLALGQIAVPDQPLVASGIGLASMGGEKSVQLGLDRLRDKLACALPRAKSVSGWAENLSGARYATTLSVVMWHILFSARPAAHQQRPDMPPNPPVTNFQL